VRWTLSPVSDVFTLRDIYGSHLLSEWSSSAHVTQLSEKTLEGEGLQA
jgi:hypothetical protein